MEKKEKKRKIKDLTPRQATIAFNLFKNWLKKGWTGRPHREKWRGEEKEGERKCLE